MGVAPKALDADREKTLHLQSTKASPENLWHMSKKMNGRHMTWIHELMLLASDGGWSDLAATLKKARNQLYDLLDDPFNEAVIQRVIATDPEPAMSEDQFIGIALESIDDRQARELSVFNDGLHSGLEIGLRSAWIKWDEENGDVPLPHQRCIGLWIHKRKSEAKMHAEGFLLDYIGHPERGNETIPMTFTGYNTRSGDPPDYWIRVPEEVEHIWP